MAERKRKRRSEEYALIPTRDFVALPGLIIPLYLEKRGDLAAIDHALKHGKEVVLAIDLSPSGSPRGRADIATMGAIARVVQHVRLSSGEYKVRVEVQNRVKIRKFNAFRPFIRVGAEELPPESLARLSRSTEALMNEIKEHFSVLLQYDGGMEAIVNAASDLSQPGELADIIASALPLSTPEAQQVLEETNPERRLRLVSRFLNTHINVVNIRERVADRAQLELGRVHHRELLEEQLRQIQEELGEGTSKDGELEEFQHRLEALKLPAIARKEAERQMSRLRQLHPDASETALVRTYLEWILDLPWSKRSRELINLERAKAILERDHYGLEKTKERILDYLGVRKLRSEQRAEQRGAILLLVGPPGVGKTSLGRSIATALARKFVRISVGGLRDEAELRGHRRTYVGALPGRIIQGLKSAGTKNPVFMLDELDKIGSDFRGDPASALLEVLDPEQNRAFEDHYLNIPFDLSEVMFIGTANVTDTVPAALLDRMEVIEISGYTTEEKLEIAKRYLIPRELTENGIGDYAVAIPQDPLLYIIQGYTRESGVRELGRGISTVFRKIARAVAEGEKPPARVTRKLVERYLGPARFVGDRKQSRDEVGVVTGLAWTPVGGETLTIEVSLTPGKGSLSLTGQLGEVMRESGMAALTYVLSNSERLGIDPNFYDRSNVHLHVPQGAIAKDGPSAGIAMAVALVSLLTWRPVSRNVAMTGEITLRGAVLSVGGVREKALAALRIGIPTVVIPEDNRRELVEFPRYLLDQVRFIPVKHVDQALEAALLPLTLAQRAEGVSRRKSVAAVRSVEKGEKSPG